MPINELIQKRAAAFDLYRPLAEKTELTVEERAEHDRLAAEVDGLDDQLRRAREAQARAAATAQPVAGQDRVTVPASLETSPYANDEAARAFARRQGATEGSARSLVLGGIIKMAAAGHGNLFLARQAAAEAYGEAHPITRALVTSVGSAGGFIVPPDYVNEIIELLRPQAVVRSAGPRVIPMPRGTMVLPAQTQAATASYGTEAAKIATSQQTVGQITASFKKLTALVPVSNDMMRYADPAVDAFVRDDLVKVIALREDLAFLMGDGTAGQPTGMLSIANRYAVANGGSAGVWNSAANSTAASGGQFITSAETIALADAAKELGGMPNKLDTANVVQRRRTWFMHPRTRNYLYEVQNSLGVFVFRQELDSGKLWGYPIALTTQLPINLYDATGGNTDCGFLFLVEMDEVLILDSMTLELAVSREGTYIDGSGNTISAFQFDQTLVRAVTEHDFQMRHDAAVVIDQFNRWAPAIS